MTAEFAVVLPVVLLVLVLCVGVVRVAAQQVALASLASSGARMLARGDGQAAMRSVVAGGAEGVAITQSGEGPFVCVALRQTAHFGPVGLGSLELRARGCALAPDPAATP